MGSETISAVMSALAIILGMIGAMFSVKHTASSIEKTSVVTQKKQKRLLKKFRKEIKTLFL